MGLLNDVRRAFAANPHKVPLGEGENATLEARGIQEPTLRIYFAWRRSLMVFVVIASLVNAGVVTYRSQTEADYDEDTITSLAEHFLPPGLLGEDEGDDESGDEGAAAPTTPGGQAVAMVGTQAGAKPTEPAKPEEPVDQRNTFAKFTDNVELAALYALPVAALAVVLLWTRFQASFSIMVAAFGFSFLVPILIALCPWSWWGVIEPDVSEKTNPLEFWKLKVEGLLEGAMYLFTLLPTVLSLVPGVQRACIRVKLLLPQSMLPGFFLTAASPFYALFLLVIFTAVNQFDTHPLFFAGMLIFMAAPLTYAVMSDLVTRPLATDDDFRRMKLVQRFVGLMTVTAAALIVAYLTTREFRGVHLLGLNYEHSLLVPLDVVEFALEVLSRSMFVTVLGADLFMRMNLKAWKHQRAFRGTSEAANYDRVMGEFEQLN